MDLKDQVSNKELSKRICELGVKQESLWYWIVFYNNSSFTPLEEFTELVLAEQYFSDEWEEKEYLKIIERYSAPTVAELGERLPKNIYSQKSGRKDFKWACYVDESMAGHKTQWANTEANARAKMLIYLRENKKIEEG